MLNEFTHIRESTQDELDAFDKLLNENTYNSYYEHWFSDSYNFGRHQKNDGHQKKFLTIVDMKEDDTPKGLIEITRQTERTVAKLGFVIFEEFKGKGRGRRAIEEVLDLCKKMGITNLILNTTSAFLAEYYKEFDFKVVGVELNVVRLMNYDFAHRYTLQKIEKEVPNNE